MIRQRDLTAELERKIKWGSHIPLNESIIESFPVTGVLELGAGFNSTPLFFKKLTHVTSIEADKNWINELLNNSNINNINNKRIVHHFLPENIKRSTPREKIDKSIMKSAIEFYQLHCNSNLNYLFVDQYTGFRLASLQSLYNKFDIIAWHDAQIDCDKNYGYSKFKHNSNYLRFKYTTFPGHTGLLLSKKLENLIPQFKISLEFASERYANKFGIDHNGASGLVIDE